MDSPVVTVGLTLLLVATMLAVGTRLTPAAFIRLAKQPGLVGAALLVNVLVIPGAAVAAVSASNLAGPVAYGIVLAAAAPGGSTGTLLAYHARGDLALAVTLQGALAPIGLVTVPLWTLAMPHDSAGLRTGAGVRLTAILAIQVLPLAVGMLLRARRPVIADRVRTAGRRAADVLFIGMTVYVIAVTAGAFARIPALAYAAMTAVVGTSLGVYVLPGLGTGAARRSVAATAAVRNLSLALLVAGLAAEAELVAITVVAYSIVMYAASGTALIPWRRRGP